MLWRPLTALSLIALYAGRAEAQRPEADAEFQRGRTLMAAGRIAEACAAFEASMKLEPARGTLYNLGLCHEKLGKIASAWSELDELARTDTNKDRAKDARQRADALLPRLPKMHLVIEHEAGAETVTRNDIDVTALAGKDTPIDPGHYTFEATAPGKKSFTKEVDVAEGKTVEVTVPELRDAEPGAGPAPEKPTIDPEVFPVELPRRPILVPHNTVEVTGLGSILTGHTIELVDFDGERDYDRTAIDAGARARAHLGPFEFAALVGFHVRSPYLNFKPNPWDTIGLAIRYPIQPLLVVGISYVEVQPLRDGRGSDLGANVERKLLLFPNVAVDGIAGLMGSSRENNNAFVVFGEGRIQVSVIGGLSLEGRTSLELNLGGQLYDYTVGLQAAGLALYAITPRVDAFAQAASSLLPDPNAQAYTFGVSWRSR